MFRLFRLFLILILVVGIVAGVYLWRSRIETLESFFSKRLNTKVTIEGVQLGWGKLTLEGLRIANPPQSSIPYAFQGGIITLEMNPFELLGGTIHIDRLKIQNPQIGVELYNSTGSDNNWSRLLNHLPPGDGRKIVIKTLTILNLQFEILRSNGKSIRVPSIPYLELEDIGEKRALSLSEVSRVVFQIILQKLASQARLGALLNNVSSLPSALSEGVKSRLPLEETKGVIREGLDSIRRKTEEASEFLQDLFSSN